MTAATKQKASTTAFMIPFFTNVSSFQIGNVNRECPVVRTLPIVMRFSQNLNYYFTKIFDIGGVCSGACAFR